MVRSESAGGASGLADDEFRGEGDFRNKWSAIFDTVEQSLCGDGAHLKERLMDGGKGRDRKRGNVNVVEADDGNVVGDFQARFLKDGHGAYGGNVVIGDNSCEGELGGQERFCR